MNTVFKNSKISVLTALSIAGLLTLSACGTTNTISEDSASATPSETSSANTTPKPTASGSKGAAAGKTTGGAGAETNPYLKKQPRILKNKL